MGKRKSLLDSIEDESTLFLNKTPEDLLKDLQTRSHKVKDIQINRNKSQTLEKQVHNLINETDGRNDKYEKEKGMGERADSEGEDESYGGRGIR